MTAYADAERPADIVMKGGITSGIVCPKAVCELAKTFRFKSIGGTSAGAIAAAATAAAELGRRRGSTKGFEELEQLPEFLGGRGPDGERSRLFSLFTPNPATRPIFRTIVAGLAGGSMWKIVVAALTSFWVPALLVLAPGGALVGWVLAANLHRGSAGLGIASAVVIGAFVLLLMLGAVAFAFFRTFTRSVPANFYGLSTGMGTTTSLTPWLMDLLDRLAGKTATEGPLTFGDLWGNAEPHELTLQMMTTNLSHGRPYRLPFDGPEERVFYFDPAELRLLFPERIVQWMIDHSGLDRNKGDAYIPLPLAKDLPVVVAARMSLSFPLLIGAVPLHTRELSDPKRRWERCWFSDGGISSNFPVHFFDSPLPRWPTFAINLRPEASNRVSEDVEMAKRNSDGLEHWWIDIDEGSGFARLKTFVGAILDTMQNWTDNMQMRLPGYRDRIAHITVRDGEGGLNLDMPAERVTTLSGRGREAGRRLADRMHPSNTQELSWDNHRWVRYRSTMALLEDMIGKIKRAMDDPVPGDRKYVELITRAESQLPASYRWARHAQRDFADDATKGVARMAAEWAATRQTFSEGAPRPTPELRVRPRV